MSTPTIGEKLRELREAKKLPLRKVATLIDTDVAILSKMERGERRLNKEVIKKLAKIYNYPLDELMVLYLSNKVMEDLKGEDMGVKALQAAEEQMTYVAHKKAGKATILKIIKIFLEKDKRVKAAWLFGSFARGEEHANSDIDIMVRFSTKQKISLFDFADIVFQLEQLTKRKIDMVEEGFLKPFANETTHKDLIQIYG